MICVLTKSIKFYNLIVRGGCEIGISVWKKVELNRPGRHDPGLF